MAGFYKDGDAAKVQQILDQAHAAQTRAEITAALLVGIVLGGLAGIMFAALVWWAL